MGLKFLRPDENLCYGASVATSSGTTDSTYTDDWLCDGRPGRPAKATGTSVTWAITVPSGTLSIVVLHNHNLTAGTITIGGTIAPTLTVPTARTNGIPVNPWGTDTEATGTSVTVAIANNAANVVIGEVLAGKVRETSRGLQISRTSWGYLDVGVIGRRNRTGSVGERDLGICARWLKSTLRCKDSDRALIEGWFEASRSGTRPSVIIPWSDANDAWVVQFSEPPRFTPLRHISTSSGLWDCDLAFEEEPRRRW